MPGVRTLFMDPELGGAPLSHSHPGSCLPHPTIHTVVIADGFPLVAAGLAELITATGEFRVVQICPDPQALTEALALLEPELLVLDIEMPGLLPFALLRRLRRTRSEMAVLVVTGLPGEVYATPVVEAGARGFLSKRSGAETLLPALRCVIDGNLWMHGDWALPALRRRRWLSRPGQPRSMSDLTSRELEVFQLLGSGRSTREIGQALHVSHRTVASHRLRIYRKLGIRSLSELLHRAVEYRQLAERDGALP
jgi:DNA-binding NarL/FixJ family response regulator